MVSTPPQHWQPSANRRNEELQIRDTRMNVLLAVNTTVAVAGSDCELNGAVSQCAGKPFRNKVDYTPVSRRKSVGEGRRS